MFTVYYTTVDHYYKRRTFKTLAGARKFAQKMVGPHPDVSETYGYAVSDDGTGKVTCAGTTLSELFPAPTDDKKFFALDGE